MWQPVAWIDDRLLRRAYGVISEGRSTDESFEDFKSRVIRHQVHLFYRRGEDFEIVLGFLPRDDRSRWLVTCVGLRGTLSMDQFELGINKAIAFSQSQRLAPISVSLRKLPPTDPMSVAFSMALTRARSHPSVREVREVDSGDRRILTAIIRPHVSSLPAEG